MLAVTAALATAGCGGGGGAEEGAREPSERLRAVLSQAPDSGAVAGLVAGDTLGLSRETLEFYRGSRFRPVFTDGDGLTERGEQLFSALGGAVHDGLDPARYGHVVATRLLQALKAEEGLDDAARSDYAADLELVLAEGFVRYAQALQYGTADPETAERSWQISRDEPAMESVLRSAARGDANEIVQKLRPSTPYYARMVQALGRLRQVKEAGGWQPLPEGMAVEEGDSSSAVAALRARMVASDDPREAALAQRGAARPHVYDRDLKDAVRHFQERHALVDDGHIGAGTLRELNHSVDERIAEVELNLDRWRWLPNDLGRFFVLVNIAGFELEVVENGQVIEAMNVVVGEPGWKTPVFADTMESIVVNPYWTPTANIMEDEILPAMARDPGYLARNNFERTANGGVRQRPGPSNALGYYKFLFPNSHDIYLHDTPADHLFSRTRRDFSHGCIRLERPADLARLIAARTTSHTAASIEAMRRTGSEKWITLKRPVPVYLVYFTTWVRQDGTLEFHHDVYGHDEELREAETQAQQVAAEA